MSDLIEPSLASGRTFSYLYLGCLFATLATTGAGAGCGRIDIAPSGDDGATGDDGSSNVRGQPRKPTDGGAEVGPGETGSSCTPGQRTCDGSTPLTCDSNGGWQSGAVCAHACSEGGCVGTCTPGETSCTGNIPQSCGADGQWQTAAACPFLCSQGACAGVCLPGARQCDGSGIPQTCDDGGQWQGGAACPFVCAQGLCAGVCHPGDRGCNGAVPQTCSAGGDWQSAAACSYVCSAGACVGSCLPGAHQCSGNVPQTCGTGGQWQAGAPCPFVCTAAGSCGGVCVPSARQCSNGQLQSCDASGAWQVTGTASSQLLANPGFDLGPGSWGEVSSAGEIVTFDDGTADTSSQTAPYLAWLGGYDGADDEIFQTVNVPAAATASTLTFYYQVFTEESPRGSEFDTLNVYVTGPDGVPTRVAHLSDNTVTAGWTRFSAALPPALAGHAVEVRFVGATDSSLTTSFYVDTTSLDVTACPSN